MNTQQATLAAATLDERARILQALQEFIHQRPGMDPRNYDYAGYRAESRSVTQDLHHAEKLLAAVRWRTSITADKLKEAFKHAFSGRLSWVQHPAQPLELQPSNYYQLDYCTGQYFPTEFRKAVCAVLASALWDYWRASYAAPIKEKHPGGSMAAAIRMSARKEFGLTIAQRYFDYRAEDYK